jgi:hypothetical protein
VNTAWPQTDPHQNHKMNENRKPSNFHIQKSINKNDDCPLTSCRRCNVRAGDIGPELSALEAA